MSQDLIPILVKKVPNPLNRQDLLAVVGVYSYDSGVTDAQFWRAVGEQLLLTRKRRGWKHATDIERNGGPTNKTVDLVEAGKIGRISVLQEHVAALGLTVVDVFRAVLSVEKAIDSPEAAHIVTKYGTTTVEGRRALLALAVALPDEAPELPATAPVAPAPTPTKKPSSPRRVRK